MARSKTQERATKLAAGALSMFDAAVQDLKFANELHTQVEDESIAEAARLTGVANESRTAREKNERVVTRILGLIDGDE